MLASASSSKPGTTPLVTLSQLNASASAANTVNKKLTRPSLGLMYYVPDGEYYSSPSVELNSWAVWLAEQVQQSTLQGLPFSGSIKAAVPTWKAAAEGQLVKNAKEAREPRRGSSMAYSSGDKPVNM
jgi:hypothetical protein